MTTGAAMTKTTEKKCEKHPDGRHDEQGCIQCGNDAWVEKWAARATTPPATERPNVGRVEVVLTGGPVPVSDDEREAHAAWPTLGAPPERPRMTEERGRPCVEHRWVEGDGRDHGRYHCARCMVCMNPLSELSAAREREARLLNQLDRASAVYDENAAAIGRLNAEVAALKKEREQSSRDLETWKEMSRVDSQRAERAEAQRDALREALERIAAGNFNGAEDAEDIACAALATSTEKK